MQFPPYALLLRSFRDYLTVEDIKYDRLSFFVKLCILGLNGPLTKPGTPVLIVKLAVYPRTVLVFLWIAFINDEFHAIIPPHACSLDC